MNHEQRTIMSRVVIIGCGVVGAAIAYELSQIPGLKITVIDKQQPAQGATGAALGVMMGAISHKIKGNAWQLRQTSIQRYETLIPELEALTNRKIPFNRQGIVMLCFEGEDLARWEKLVEIRKSQGWHLEIWDAAKVRDRCPHLSCDRIIAAIYSPQDRQVEPVALTLALVEAAQLNGVNFKFGVTVLGNESTTSGVLKQIHTSAGELECDRAVIAAGLGSTPITASLNQNVDIRPVLGQALHLQLPHPIGNRDFQPAITGDDVHIVPCGANEYWIGATVEFSANEGDVVASSELLEKVRQNAIAFCPSLAEANIIKTWSGLRPRPEGRPAPIIGKLPGYSNVLLATGHYRNGVLLAPATALTIRDAITLSLG